MLIRQLVLNLPRLLVKRYQAIKFAVFDIVRYVFVHPCQSTRESLDAAVGVVCGQESICLNSLGYTAIVVRG